MKRYINVNIKISNNLCSKFWNLGLKIFSIFFSIPKSNFSDAIRSSTKFSYKVLQLILLQSAMVCHYPVSIFESSLCWKLSSNNVNGQEKTIKKYETLFRTATITWSSKSTVSQYPASQRTRIAVDSLQALPLNGVPSNLQTVEGEIVPETFTKNLMEMMLMNKYLMNILKPVVFCLSLRM